MLRWILVLSWLLCDWIESGTKTFVERSGMVMIKLLWTVMIIWVLSEVAVISFYRCSGGFLFSSNQVVKTYYDLPALSCTDSRWYCRARSAAAPYWPGTLGPRRRCPAHTAAGTVALAVLRPRVATAAARSLRPHPNRPLPHGPKGQYYDI